MAALEFFMIYAGAFRRGDGLYPQKISFDPVKARYVEVIIKSDKLPTWHGGAGNPAFLFVDEINLQ